MKALDLEATMRAVQILDESGKIDTIKQIIAANNGNIDAPAVLNLGVEIITGACGKKSADDTVELLAYVFDKTPDEVRKTSIKELVGLFKQLAKDNDLTVFLKTCMS